MAGDPKQLPPTLVSEGALDANLDRTLFERLQDVGERTHTGISTCTTCSQQPDTTPFDAIRLNNSEGADMYCILYVDCGAQQRRQWIGVHLPKQSPCFELWRCNEL